MNLLNSRFVLYVSLCLVLLTSCSGEGENRLITDRFPNGDKKTEIELGDSKDTLRVIHYYENGKVKSVIPYKDGLINGIKRDYDASGEKIREALSINGIEITQSVQRFDSLLGGTETKFYRRINPREMVSSGYLFQRDGKIVSDKSLYYRVFADDTCSINEQYVGTIEFVCERDSVYFELYLGSMDERAELVDTSFYFKDWVGEALFGVKPQRHGYNYITGKLVVLRLYDKDDGLEENELKYKIDTLIFQHEYFVE